jgi:hypothetical protein
MCDRGCALQLAARILVAWPSIDLRRRHTPCWSADQRTTRLSKEFTGIIWVKQTR